MVTLCLTINNDLTWVVHVHGHNVKPKITARPPLSSIPEKLTTVSFQALFGLLNTCTVCPGHPDELFEDMAKGKKGKFLSVQGKLVTFEDEGFVIDLNGKKYMRTIRTSQCDIPIHGGKCEPCSQFRPTLRAMHSRWVKKPQSPKTPKKYTYLNTPEKLKKLKSVQARTAFLLKEVDILSKKLSPSTVPVDAALNTHLIRTYVG